MSNISAAAAAPAGTPATTSREGRWVVIGASLGTLFEWYDFLIYGSLAAVISQKFFAGVHPTAAFVFTLIAFGAGFFIRPLAAIGFGRLGDRVGRKLTFLVTMMLMGVATFGIGLLPTYESIGFWAPVLLITLRVLQGVAMGGEYGGAATYVAEFAPPERRGLHTSAIQLTATAGLLLALIVVFLLRQLMEPAAFNDWGWRVPFLLSIVLLALSMWIRIRLNESPVFQKMKAEGRTSASPVLESFGSWTNLRLILIALCLSAGPATVWSSGQFYSLFFLTQTLKVDPTMASLMLAIAIVLAAPVFVLSGMLSDRIGRKPLVLAGLLLAALTYIPIFKAMTFYANPALATAQAAAPATIIADPNDCSVQFNPTGTSRFVSSCDTAKAALVSRGVPYSNQAAPAGTSASIQIGGRAVAGYRADAADAAQKAPAFNRELDETLRAVGYPLRSDAAAVNKPMIVLLLFILVAYVGLAYGPLAAMLTEMFPTKIRYTSFSLPYHLGSGWFGGFVPAVAFSIQAATGNLYDGLWYPILVAGFAFVIGLLFLRETKNAEIGR